MTDQAVPSRSFKDMLLVYFERRVFVMLLLGFSAGLPFMLIFDTLSAWLRQSDLSLQTISIFALATLSYALKFIWAPLIDRVRLPLLDALFGHRRAWMLAMQGLIILGLWLISGSNPEIDLWRVALLAVFVGFAGATQDIVIDAWRIEVVEEERYGAMAAAYQWGYRGAIIAAGAIPLLLAETINWNFSYAVMAAMMLIGIAGTLFAPREKSRPVPFSHVSDMAARPVLEGVEWAVRIFIILTAALFLGSGLAANATILAEVAQVFGVSDSAGEAIRDTWRQRPFGVYWQLGGVVLGLGLLALAAVPLPGASTRPSAHISRAYGEPLGDFFKRFGGGLGAAILALICLYRLSDFVLNLMNPFYIDLGFTLAEIAEVRKVFGVFASLGGVLLCGYCVAKLGIIRTMLIGVFASPLSNLAFIWLSMTGADVATLYVVIGIDNSATGFAGTALIVYMSSLTGPGFTATQYALFSSLYALLGKLVATQSGRVVEAAARSADTGGPISILLPFYRQLPQAAYEGGAEASGVAADSLGAGYATFFIYSVVIGLFAIYLAFRIAGRQQEIQAKAGKTPESGDR